MITWILLITIWGQESVTTTQIEYGKQEDCVSAGNDYQAKTPKYFWKRVETACLKKVK